MPNTLLSVPPDSKSYLKSKPLHLVYKNFQGRNPYNILLVFLENQCLHKFILSLSDLYVVCRIQKSIVRQISKKFSNLRRCRLDIDNVFPFYIFWFRIFSFMDWNFLSMSYKAKLFQKAMFFSSLLLT